MRQQQPDRINAGRDFCASVARNLLKLVRARDGQVGSRLGTILKIQLNSAVAARYGVAADVENVGVLLPPDQLQIQREVRDAIARIRRQDYRVLELQPPIASIDVVLTRESRGLRAGLLLPDGLAAFWIGIALALEQAGDLIQECQRCRELYVRLRGQKYCSKTCGQRDRSAKHYKTHHEEILEQRHDAYKRKQRARYAKARVQRRKRSHA